MWPVHRPCALAHGFKNGSLKSNETSPPARTCRAHQAVPDGGKKLRTIEKQIRATCWWGSLWPSWHWIADRERKPRALGLIDWGTGSCYYSSHATKAASG